MTHWMEGDWPDDCDVQPKMADGDIQRLIDVCGKVLRDGLEKHRAALNEATADAAEWMHHSDDPLENGWVGHDGLP